MQNRKAKGAVYKINMPTFDFSFAEAQEREMRQSFQNKDFRESQSKFSGKQSQGFKKRLSPDVEKKTQNQTNFKIRNHSNHVAAVQKQEVQQKAQKTTQGFGMSNLIKSINKTQNNFGKTKGSQFSKSSQIKMSQYISIPMKNIQSALNMHIYQKQEIKDKRIIDNDGFFNKLITGQVDKQQFSQYGLQCTKNLINYDVWDEDISNEELFKLCQNQPGPHAKSPGYINHQYIWQDVDVLEYNSQTNKFKVLVYGTNQIKETVKLTILFYKENNEKFFQRLFMAKNLQNNAQDEMRYLNYISNIDKSLTSEISHQMKERILKKVKAKTDQAIRTLNDLEQQFIKNYSLHMNKCVVLKEMLQIENELKFKDLRIELRKPSKYLPYFGTVNGSVTDIQYDLKPYQEILIKNHISKHKSVIKTLDLINQRSSSFEKQFLYNTKMNHNQLPMNLVDFENLQKIYHKEQLQTLLMQWREYLISEIQDSLRDTFRFYQTDLKVYRESELKKLLTRIDFMFNTYLRENVFKANIYNWCQFIKNFNYPQENENFKKSTYPLLNINLIVNVNYQQNNKKKRAAVEKQEEEKVLYFEPSLQKIIEVISYPIHQICETSESFIIMEKDLVPLVDVSKKSVFISKSENQIIEQSLDDIKKYLNIAFRGPQQILDDFSKFQFLFERSQKNIFRSIFGESKDPIIIDNLSRDKVQQDLQEYILAKNGIQQLSVTQKNCGFFKVNSQNAKEGLIHRCNELITTILQKVHDICVDNVKRIQNNYMDMFEKLEHFPLNEKELVVLKSFINAHEKNISINEKSVYCVDDFLDLLQVFNFQYCEQELETFWTLGNYPTAIKAQVFEGQKNFLQQEIKFMDILDVEKDKFAKELQQLLKFFAQVKKFKDYTSVKENAIQATHLKDQIDSAYDQVKSFNEREVIFKQPLSEYHDLNELNTNFEPFFKLWENCIDYDLDKQEWYNGPFLKQNFSLIEKKIDSYLKNTHKLNKLFLDLDEECAANIAQILIEDVQSFRKNLWMIELLCTEVMVKKPMYWKEVFEKCNVVEIDPNDDMSLKILTDIGMFNHQEEIQEISYRVDKQYSLEKKMNEMIDNLRGIKIGILKYKNFYIIKSQDEIVQQLDDTFNILIFMKSSPFIKPILRRANDLEQRLLIVQDTLEGWIKCQRSWMYLQPIFESEDIKKKMPLEHQRFGSVDKQFRQLMDNFAKDQHLWDNIDSDKMKNEFETNNKTLDQIQKSLSEYLETKRKVFPRFFFLSDDQLLEILAQTKDPTLVQRHVNKCFEAINLLQFNENEVVHGMISPEKEIVPFSKMIDVNDGEKKGNVEKWLLEIEFVMRDTLKQIAKKSLIDETERTQWVLKYPAMIVLMGNMIRWTLNSEQALKNQKLDSKSISAFVQILNDELIEIVKLVRSNLSELDRLTLGALVVLDVHNRDVVDQFYADNVQSIQEFAWLSQLRYYQEEKRGHYNVPVKCINAIYNYGFEYLGNSTRLVITPLTDRCYRTLMGAYHLNYGGAPEGPAGTGKTETTKDLAKALAMQCVVFNCSDQLNFQAMSKFFKGLASSGAWCCFDEFNRIDLEVLSVIAQQVITIQNAIKMRCKRFEFDGDEIDLILTCVVNITMNPGYAGRSDLPDNLKALFRTVAMMVPDYKLIAEIFLYSVGFQDARNLARKIVASLRLSSEQLSSQYHYDFGMRALKAILTAAGDLKRKLDEKEDILALIALMDVNLPKFTLNDIPLFKSITSDLFPGVKLNDREYTDLLDAITLVCKENNWIPQTEFLNKCIQLYDTIMVRHGLMMVGEAMCGKSVIIECLRQAMCKLNGTSDFNKVEISKLNPKSIMSHQLYGLFDNDTKQWTDGVLPKIMRELATQGDNPERKWVIFDGPVDAVWIENMNTVLDDNKKLCLTSGEIIKLTRWMTMMFEVEDLQHASPATVSRCGMVFLEAKNLQWNSLLQSYLNKSFPKLLEKHLDYVLKLVQRMADPCFAFIKKHGKFPMQYAENQIIMSLINIIKHYLDIYKLEGAKAPKDFEDIVQNIVTFAVIWSIGAILEESARPLFHIFLLEFIQGQNVCEKYKIDLLFDHPLVEIPVKILDFANIYDICYDQNKQLWLNWMQIVPSYKIPVQCKIQDLIIPTIDSVRNNFLLKLFIGQKSHMLQTGPTGTGKTINIINELNVSYYNETFTNFTTAFSGQTTCNQVQKAIEVKMNSRRGKGRFGPEDRKDMIIIFIDDLNMPAKEKYLAQPPIEILRQWMNEGGWYDLESMEWKYLDNIIFVSAMGPPSQGRNSVSLRYTRHYNVLYVESFLPNSLQRIFHNIMEWFFLNNGRDMGKQVENLGDKIVESTIQIYNIVKSSKELLPTPAKSHYIYNLRDIQKVFQGIARVNHIGCRDHTEFIKVWAHECMRVFQDRLIDSNDQQFFDQQLKKLMKENFNMDWSNIVQVEPLIWGSFVPTIYPNGDTSKRQISDIYCELTDIVQLNKQSNQILDEYNKLFSANRMDLVLFMNAIQHITRIVRILQTPLGHALLVGVGGSGRKSLATLSTFIVQFELFQCDAKNWIDELQKLIKMVGLDQKPVVFLFSDTQVQNEAMYEDICNLLNNGEVPNLFPLEEKAKIVEEISNVMPVGTMNQKYAYFISQCRENLHLVLCMSPVGEGFRRRIRTFPGLVNCTTIDWFLPWPEEALRSTAKQAVSTVDIKGDEEHNQQIKEGIVEIFVGMHLKVKKMAISLLSEYRRYNYVTPTSYLELLSTFKRIHDTQQNQVINQISRYENGLTKLQSTEEQVQEMQIKLEQLIPVLDEKTKENQIMLTNLQANQKTAFEQRLICEEEERVTNIQRMEATSLKESCESDLSKVLPLLEAANEALSKIKGDDINMIKSYVQPPSTLYLLMQSVCIALGEDSQAKWKVKDPNDPSKGKEQDFWEYSKRVLLNNKLIGKIQTYKEEKIKDMNPKSIQKLKTICAHPDYQKDKIFKVSEPAGNISLWIRACVETFDALLIVEPKRLQLAEAEKKLRIAESTLAQKQSALKDVMDLLQKLEDEYNQAKKEKEDLEASVNKCQKQLDNAKNLIRELAGEKVSWGNKQIFFQDSLLSITGDILLSSGIIAYLGAFMMSYRDNCIQEWKDLLQEKHIRFTQNFSIQEILSDTNSIGIWVNQHKLPNDKFSIENAIIVKNSSRWPLLIDPQLQANQWLREMVGRQNIKILRQNMAQNELLFTLENSISFGSQCLLENIGEEIDPIFESILQNKIIKQGGQLKIKLGDKLIDFCNEFKFFITTKLSNPHYPPEICVKVTLLNFMVTPEGLEDQMLNIVVKIENAYQEEQRQKNIKEYFENKNKQKQTEDKILKMLSEASGNILDDEELIETLQNSKIESNEIQDKLQISMSFQEQFKLTQNKYKDVAKRSSNLYFAVVDLAQIEPVYQFSLEFYIDLFERSVEKTSVEKTTSSQTQKVININNNFTSNLFLNIVRSLLEKDKLTFSMLIAIRIMQEEKKMITHQEVRFVMVGGTSIGCQKQNPSDGWLSDRQWANIEELSNKIQSFKEFDTEFIQNVQIWKTVYESQEPYNCPEWPTNWAQSLNSFQKLLITRILRPDKFIAGVQYMIKEQMDSSYIEFPPFDLSSAFEDSNSHKPLIFILSPGADPRVEVETLALKMSMTQNLIIRSLGQGQGESACAAIEDSIQQGKWVFLQNCHLAASFMPKLEQIFENISDSCSPEFRMWLTTAPSKVFPVSVLQKGVKMTYEPPKGIKNSLMRSYLSYDHKMFEDCSKSTIWKRLLFGLSFFHAMALERRKFGPLGWNIPYEFSAADLAISVLQLKIFLEDYEEIQWPALNYMVAEANYGGRVTDDKDRILIKILLKTFYQPEALDESYVYSQSNIYYCPQDGNIESYREYIRELPINDQPEVFGMHDNAQISASINETNSQCQTILGLLPRIKSGEGSSPEQMIQEKCIQILEQIPKEFELDQIAKKFPIQYKQSMNTVLQQELIRYNKMIYTITNSLDNLNKAIDGIVSMSNELEELFNAIFDNKVSEYWTKVAYPSLKPLGSWILDFYKRLNFMQTWIDNGAPSSFWISGFYFTQSFFTGVLQNYARKFQIPIDTLTFDFKPIAQNSTEIDINITPENGCYIYGLYLDGCKWDENEQCIDDQDPKVLYFQMAYLQFIPVTESQLNEIKQIRYSCPVYKTSLRRGTLSTTGHSTNFVMSILLNIQKNDTPEKWTKRGLAMLTQLDD